MSKKGSKWTAEQHEKFRMTIARKRNMKKKRIRKEPNRIGRRRNTETLGSILDKVLDIIIEKKVKKALQNIFQGG